MSMTIDFRGGPADSGPAGCRRRVRRELTCALLYADFGAGNGGIVLNLSEEGFSVLAAMPLEAGSFSRMRFKGGGDGGRMEASGRVVWISDSRKTAGVQFIELSDPARRQIREWIALAAGPNRAEPPVSHSRSQTIQPAPSADEHGRNDDEVVAELSPFLGGEAGESRHAFQPGPLLHSLPVAPHASDKVSLQTTGRLVPTAPRASVSSGKAMDGRDDPATALVGQRLVSKALGGATVFLLSLLTFVLGWLWYGNLRAGRNDATRLLNAAPATTIGDQASGPRAPDKPEMSPLSAIEPIPGPVIAPKPAGLLAHGASDDEFQSPAAATGGSPGEWLAPHIVASASRSAEVPYESSLSTVRPDLEQRAAAAVAQRPIEAPPTRSPDSVSSTQTETVQMPVPSFDPDGTPLSHPPPAENSLTASDASASAAPDTLPGAAEPHPANSVVSSPAVPTTASPGHLESCYLIQPVQPVYPPEARKRHLEGTVKLRLVVDTDGRVRTVDLVSGSPLLAPAAIDAARQFRYRPALLDGQPIETIQTTDIYFQLKH